MYRNEPADPPMDEEPEEEYPRIIKREPLPVMVCTGCNARRPFGLPFIEGDPHKDCPGHPGWWSKEPQAIEYRIAYGNGMSLPLPPQPEEPNVFEDMERDEALLDLDAKHSTADDDVISAAEKDYPRIRIIKREPMLNDISGLQSQIERYANRLDTAQHTIASQQEHIDILAAIIDWYRNTVAGLRGAVETSAKVVATLDTELKTTRSALISTGEMWAQANKAYGMAEAEKLEMAGTIRRLTKERDDIATDYAMLRKERDTLKDELSRKEIALQSANNAIDYERRNLDLARRQVGEWAETETPLGIELDGIGDEVEG